MVFNATFNTISTISWWSVSLVEETGVPGEKHNGMDGLPYNIYTLSCKHNGMAGLP
jgi:hypothetical protein